MPETRYTEVYKDGVLIDREPYQVSDEELAEEVERAAILRAEELIDNISSLADTKIFLKRLCKRLIKKGLLP